MVMIPRRAPREDVCELELSDPFHPELGTLPDGSRCSTEIGCLRQRPRARSAPGRSKRSRPN